MATGPGSAGRTSALQPAAGGRIHRRPAPGSQGALLSDTVELPPEGVGHRVARHARGYQLLERSVRTSVLTGAKGSKNKLLAIQTTTRPQLVCVGLPWYDRYIVEPAKRRWEQAALDAVNARHAAQTHSGVKKARKEYFTALERYCATAIALDHGLRIKQYANGRWGYHFIGTWVSGKLVEVVTNWYGDKRDPAGLKITEKKEGLTPTERFGRPLRHSFVNYERLETYLRVFREERLRASGALAPDEPYSVDDPRWALFATTDAPRHGKRRRMVSPGAYNRDHVSVQLIGITLHQIARECFGRDVPAWDDLTGDAATTWWASGRPTLRASESVVAVLLNV